MITPIVNDFFATVRTSMGWERRGKNVDFVFLGNNKKIFERKNDYKLSSASQATN